jgi:ankyrin repeat protein
VVEGHAAVVRLLLEAALQATTAVIDPRIKDELKYVGSTLLHLAAQAGHAEAVQVLLAAVPKAETKTDFWTEHPCTWQRLKAMQSWCSSY